MIPLISAVQNFRNIIVRLKSFCKFKIRKIVLKNNRKENQSTNGRPKTESNEMYYESSKAIATSKANS